MHLLSQLQQYKRTNSRSLASRGQAMVEFAIILILVVILIVGGAELAISMFHASKATDGAKAGANEWANAVSFTNGLLVSKELNITDFTYLTGISPTPENCSNDDEITATSPIIIKSGSALLDQCDLSNNTHLNILMNKLSNPSASPRYPNPLTDFAIVCTLDDPTNADPPKFIRCTSPLKTSTATEQYEKFLIEKPIAYDQTLNGPRYLLGDHSNPTAFTKANCNGTGYDNGLPDDENIYLFNPLPLDITNCDGSAGNEVGELMATLPKANQALFSQYTRVCVNDVGGVITVKKLNNCVANGFQLWLKPPGKLCGAGTTAGTEYCPGMRDLNGATGFYFFGDSNTSGNNNEFLPTSATNPQFRPTFQLVCGGADYKSSDFDVDNACNDLADGNDPPDDDVYNAFGLQVHTRYRAIYESFLAFGLLALPQDQVDTLLPYFYNPNHVGVSDQLVGTAGSEIGPIGGDNKTPTVKRFRDFRGCYEVEVIPPDNLGEQVKTSVSSCN